MQAHLKKDLTGVQKVGVKLIQAVEVIETIANMPARAYNATNEFFGITDQDGDDAFSARILYYGTLGVSTAGIFFGIFF